MLKFVRRCRWGGRARKYGLAGAMPCRGKPQAPARRPLSAASPTVHCESTHDAAHPRRLAGHRMSSDAPAKSARNVHAPLMPPSARSRHAVRDADPLSTCTYDASPLRWNHARSGLARNQEYARACASIQCAYASGFGPITRWAPNCFAQVTTGTSRRCGRCCTPSAPRRLGKTPNLYSNLLWIAASSTY